MHIQHILESSMYVDDLPQAERFYRDVLGLTVIRQEAERYVFFRCGNTIVLVFRRDVSHETRLVNHSPIPPHGVEGQVHIAFAVAHDTMAYWREQFAAHNIAIESVVEWPQGGWSLYVRDPSGNSIELATPIIWGKEETGQQAS